MFIVSIFEKENISATNISKTRARKIIKQSKLKHGEQIYTEKKAENGKAHSKKSDE